MGDRRKKHEYFEVAADMGILAYGGDIKEVYSNAAEGVFNLITDLNDVNLKEKIDIEIEGADKEELFVKFINELLYYFDIRNFVSGRIDIISIDENRLKCTAWGEEIDTSRHKLGTIVKAATYHQLCLDQTPGGYVLKFIVDI